MKKGFTLVEIVIAISISAIILSFECSVFIKCFRDYNNSIVITRDEAYEDEALIIIKNFVCRNMVEVSTGNNEICIKTSDNQIENIYLDQTSGKVMIDYYDEFGNQFKAANVVATNIKDMEVYKKENLLYVSITDIEGRDASECIGVKKVY
jgi:prepilin-type N-terminal cleavage/methylation domain-containing protein